MAAPVLAAPAVTPFDVRELDCLSEETRNRMVRGFLRAEDALAQCKIEREREARDRGIEKDSWMAERALAEGYRVKAQLFNVMLGAAIVAGVVAVTTTIIGIVK